MTASTVPLPADLLPLDFGIENLDCPVHGNIVVNLKDNETMRVNSMILGLHSPVFQDMFYNLGLVSIDMDDFTAENVREFFGALYSGRLELSKDNFREMNKISAAFKSKWLISKCTIFFYEELNRSIQVLEQEHRRIEDFIWTLEWLFNESLFAKKNTKNEDLLEFVAEKFVDLPENVLEAFVRTVLLDFNSVCLDKLHWLIRITDKDITIIAKVLKENLRLLEKGGLDENTRYLLENIDFIRDLTTCYSCSSLNELMNCEELVSRKSCRRIFADQSYGVKDFFTMETYHVFGILHPEHRCEHRCESCDYSGLFGFVLKVCPSTYKNPDSFNIQLVANVEKESLEGGIDQGFCHHHDLVRHDRIHVTFETINSCTRDSFKEHYFNFRSLDKRPYVGDGRFLWGEDMFSADGMIRLIVHVELQS